ncbi:MAG: ABC transporter permease [Burkholderiaceae bacterium]
MPDPARPAGAAPSASVLVWLAQAAWRQQPGTLLAAVVAVALGVALASGVHLVNRSALTAFAGALATVNGQADVRISGPFGSLEDALLEPIEALAGVRAASPVIESEILLNATGSTSVALPLLAIDPFRAAAIQPALAATLGGELVGPLDDPDAGTGDDPADPASRAAGADGGASSATADGTADSAPAAPLAADRVALSPAARRALGVDDGAIVHARTPLGPVRLRVAGVAPAATADERLAVMDIAAAQWWLDMTGRLTRVDVRLLPGSDPRAIAEQVRELDPNLVTSTPDAERSRMSNLSRAYRVNLNVLALVALLTGGFIVQAAMSLAAARLASSLALLGLLGAPSAFAARSLWVLALAVGTVGALLGLLLGLALAWSLLQLVGGDLGGGYFASQPAPLHPDAVALAGFAALGLVAALAGTWGPARRLARLAPMRTLRGGLIDPRPDRRRRLLASAALAALALALLWAPAIGGLPWAAYVSMGCALLAAIALIGPLLGWLASRLERCFPPAWRSPPAWLAIARLADQPGAAAIALSGVVASFALVTAMGVMVHSFRSSVDQWLLAVLPADLYLRARTAGSNGAFDQAAQEALRTIPGVESVRFLRSLELTVTNGTAPITILARELDPADPARDLPLTGAILPVDGEAADCLRVFASEPAEIRLGWRLGTRLTLPFPGAPCAIVAGVWRDYARQHGALVLALADYRRLSGDDTVGDASLTLAAGTDAASVIAEARRRLQPRIELQARSAGEIRALSLDIFDRSFALTRALEAVALLVGLFGVMTTFAGEAQARQREFGLLRHLGFTRRQITIQFASEALLSIGVGVALGAALGALLAQVLIHRVNPQSFHWRMSTDWPLASILASAFVLIVVGVLAAALVTRRSAGQAPIVAVRADW